MNDTAFVDHVERGCDSAHPLEHTSPRDPSPLAQHVGDARQHREALRLDGVPVGVEEHRRQDVDAAGVDGASIAYELRANSAFNPFKSRVLSGFSLPERL